MASSTQLNPSSPSPAAATVAPPRALDMLGFMLVYGSPFKTNCCIAYVNVEGSIVICRGQMRVASQMVRYPDERFPGCVVSAVDEPVLVLICLVMIRQDARPVRFLSKMGSIRRPFAVQMRHVPVLQHSILVTAVVCPRHVLYGPRMRKQGGRQRRRRRR